MTDPNTNCTSGWQLTGYSRITCGRANSSRLSCDSVFFPVSGGPYSQVCCRIRAYQYGLPDAFYGFSHPSGWNMTRHSKRKISWYRAVYHSCTFPALFQTHIMFLENGQGKILCTMSCTVPALLHDRPRKVYRKLRPVGFCRNFGLSSSDTHSSILHHYYIMATWSGGRYITTPTHLY